MVWFTASRRRGSGKANFTSTPLPDTDQQHALSDLYTLFIPAPRGEGSQAFIRRPVPVRYHKSAAATADDHNHAALSNDQRSAWAGRPSARPVRPGNIVVILNFASMNFAG